MAKIQLPGGLFGPKKPSQAEINKQQKELANEVREVDNRIKVKLTKLKVEDLRQDKLPQETLQTYDRIRTAMIKEFGDGEVKRLNTLEIERITEEMVDKLQKAINYGDTQTVSWIFQGMYYSVNEARKDISKAQIDNEEEIRMKRIARLEKYKSAVIASDRIREILEQIGVLKKDIESYQDQYNKKKAEMDKLFADKPELKLQLQNAGARDSIKSPELLEAADLVAVVYDLFHTIRDNRLKQANLSGQISTNEGTIRMVKTGLHAVDFTLSDDEMRILNDLQNESADGLVQVAAQRKTLAETADRIHLLYENWLNDQAGVMINSWGKYQELQDYEKRAQNDRIEGIRLKEELKDFVGNINEERQMQAN